MKIFFLFFSYHQKYRLQSHKDLSETLDLTSELLQTSHVAARLNGYLVGVGGIKQFLAEADSLGLNQTQRDYVQHYVEKNEGGGLFCWAHSSTKHTILWYNELEPYEIEHSLRGF